MDVGHFIVHNLRKNLYANVGFYVIDDLRNIFLRHRTSLFFYQRNVTLIHLY